MSKNNVLARYGAFYQGDSDLFAHCLVLRGGECVLLFQGLEVVSTKLVRAPGAKHAALVRALKKPIPAGWQKASYTGYNFITDAEGPTAGEIAVYGTRPGELAGYYAAPADSEIGQLVKAIARVD